MSKCKHMPRDVEDPAMMTKISWLGCPWCRAETAELALSKSEAARKVAEEEVRRKESTISEYVRISRMHGWREDVSVDDALREIMDEYNDEYVSIVAAVAEERRRASLAESRVGELEVVLTRMCYLIGREDEVMTPWLDDALEAARAVLMKGMKP